MQHARLTEHGRVVGLAEKVLLTDDDLAVALEEVHTDPVATAGARAAVKESKCD